MTLAGYLYMAASRKLEDLLPHVQIAAKEFLRQCTADGLDVLIYCTFRPREEQEHLYAIGRTLPGTVVTWAQPGHSWHEWRRAFDAVPLVDGKPIWRVTPDTVSLWQRMGVIGKRIGFEWAGDWPEKKREFPHFQWRDGLTISEVLKDASRNTQGSVGTR